MKRYLFIYLLLALLIASSFIGCSEHEVIDLMAITHVEVYMTLLDQGGLYAVSAFVHGTLASGCHSYHQTKYTEIVPENYSPRYSDGDTLHVEITQSEDFLFECALAAIENYDVIFLGFCEPGNYTLVVNEYVTTFEVG